MKAKNLIFIILLSFTTFIFYGQVTTQDIVVDFENKTIKPIPDFKVGDYYRIKVENINLNLWKVSLNTKDSILVTSLKTPIFSDIKLDAINSLVANLNEVTSSAQAYTLPKDLLDISTLMASIDTITPTTSTTVTKNESIVRDRLNKEKGILENMLTTQNDIINRIDKLKIDVGLFQLKGFDESDVIITTIDLQQAFEKIENLRKDIDELIKKLQDSKKDYDAFSKKYADEIKKKTTFIDADKKRKDAYGKFTVAVSKIKKDLNAEKSIELLKPIVFIKDKKGIYLSMPIQFKGEQVQVNLKFEPLKSEFNLQSYEMPFVFPVKKDSYWSIGLSFYGSNLYDKRYSSMAISVTDSTQVFRLIKENDQKTEIGIASLLRFGKKFKNVENIGYHGSIGAGVSISKKVKPRLLFGGGLTFGQKHSISIDAGGIVGYVNRKSNAFDLDTDYTVKPENVTVSEVQFGIFIAIGYLFTF